MIAKILKCGISLERIIILKIKYGNRLKLEHKQNKKPVYIGKKVNVSISKNASLSLGGGTYISDNCKIEIMENSNSNIGENVYIGQNSRIEVRTDFFIGDDTLLADNVSIYDHDHRFQDKIPIYRQGYNKSPIYISNDCWLATNVVVLKGSIIETHVVVGANAVVSKKLDANSIYVGNPIIKLKSI